MPLNVLHLMADQHHAGLIASAAHPQAITPNLDRLAASGLRFTQAYCQNPICTPSRVSLLSGQYCHNHGTYGLGGPANFGLPNLFRHFKAAGYRTAAYGKLHLPNEPHSWIAEDVDEFGDTYDNVDGTVGDSAFLRGLEAKEIRHLEDSWHNREHYGQASIPIDAMISELPYEETQEFWSAQAAMAFISQDKAQPFCLQVAFQKPHHPLFPQQQFWDLYPEDVALPETWELDPQHRPPHFRQQWEFWRERDYEFASPGEPLEETVRRMWHGTLACISQVDDIVGRLLDFLEREGLAENTIVIYGSDHGAYHAIHGQMEKAPGICSEDVCRVPYLWRVPGVTRPGSVSASLVENVDLAATVCALCGLEELPGTDGVDLTPVLRDPSARVKDVAVTENVWSKSIRWGDWRLVHYPESMFEGDEEIKGELYDLKTDPLEKRNLFADSEHQAVVAEGRARLLDWLILTTRSACSAPMQFIHNRKNPHGKELGTPLVSDSRAVNSHQARPEHEMAKNYL